jgi:periplasmic protein TonB
MFNENLLESSSGRLPVLRPTHWLMAVLAGLAGFVAASLALPVEATPSGTNILLVRAAVVGGTMMFDALAVCYAYSDARRQGFRARLWLAVVLLSSFPGFMIYLAYSASKTGDWKRATLPMAYTFEAVLISLAALVPLIYTQALPGLIHSVVPVPPAPAGVRAPTRGTPPKRQPTYIDMMHARIVIPNHIPQFSPENEITPETGPVVEGVPPGLGGVANGVPLSVLVSNTVPPPPVVKRSAPRRIVLGGQVEAARAIYTPKPEYPPLARLARIQGTVKMQAVIATDGTIQELQVLSGHPLLIAAAKQAVERWRYQPTLLNGEPVEVVTEIDVNFIFGD